MQVNKLGLALALVAALGARAASAGDVALDIDAQWHAFDVDNFSAVSGGLEWIDLNDGSALGFSFNGPVTLTVVDGGFAGDAFQIFDHGVLLGQTSVASNNYPDSVVLDFDAALADPHYSRGVFQLGAGSHSITGLLAVSALDDSGAALDATVGAVRIAAVPEPETWAMLLSGIGLIGVALRRRTR
jgi:hypothetical protein